VPRRVISFYVNTANPGNLRVADWPTDNYDLITDRVVSDPYGGCAGRDDRACAWQYGWNIAELDAQTRGVSNPGRYRWWLDVETITSWESSTRNNRADLEGMVAYFHRIGGTVGIYSMASQWDTIVKTIPSTSSLYRLAARRGLPSGYTADSAPKEHESWTQLTGTTIRPATCGYLTPSGTGPCPS
jgi:hypothetical protein